MRSKEEANDYRYFPDPDLLPLHIETSQIEKIRATLPELPQAKSQRFQQNYGLSAYDATNLISDRALGDYFEAVVTRVPNSPKIAANWIMGDLSAALNKENLHISQSPVSAEDFGALLARIEDNTISGKIAKTVFESMWNGEGSPDSIIAAQGLNQVTDSSAIENAVKAVMDANPEQLREYREGKDKLYGFFVGQVMKATQGKANPAQLNDVLKRMLSE